MTREAGVGRVMLALVVLATAILAPSGAGAVANCRSAATTQPVTPARSLNASLNGVAALSTCSVWAIGTYQDEDTARYMTVAMHWNGRA